MPTQTRTPIGPPATADGVNCAHCCMPLAAVARINHNCSYVARAEPRSGWDAGLRIDAALTAREVGTP